MSIEDILRGIIQDITKLQLEVRKLKTFDVPKASGGGGGGGGAPLGSATPEPTGTAEAGDSTNASHEDHVHALGDHDHSAAGKGGLLPLVSTTARGEVPTLPNNANLFLDGLGNWSSPFPTTNYSDAPVSNPPTNAEISAAFGDPSVVVAGYVGLINDGGAGLNEYLCASDGANWWVIPMTKAYVAPDTNLVVLALDTFTDTDAVSL